MLLYIQRQQQTGLSVIPCPIHFSFRNQKGHLWSITLPKRFLSVFVFGSKLYIWAGSVRELLLCLSNAGSIFIDLKVSLFGFVSYTSRNRCNVLPWQLSLMAVLIKWPLPSPPEPSPGSLRERCSKLFPSFAKKRQRANNPHQTG